MKMWEWIVANIGVLKDGLSIVFTFVATLVAVLTYKRARHTLLQPLRTEVVKRQTDLLVDLLDFLYDREGVGFAVKLDYQGLVGANMFLLMDEYGFVLKDMSVIEKVRGNCVGMAIVKEEGRLSLFEMPDVFDKQKEESELKKEHFDSSKEKLLLARQGVVELEVIRLTRQYVECINKLSQFAISPFMPQEIQALLKQLQSDINYNVRVVMKEELEVFVKQLCAMGKTGTTDNPLPVNTSAVYNKFNHKCRHHNNRIAKIRELTREYLMVDKKWG